MSSRLKTVDEEEASLEMLRMAALKSMSRNKDQTNERQQTLSGNCVQSLRTNNKTNKSYYNNSQRSYSSNLIVLTNKDMPSKDSHPNSYTHMLDKKSDWSEKHKRVLPGRFSRLEREDTDEDSDEYSDECNEDNQSVTISALNMTSDDKSDILATNMSDNTTSDDLFQTNTELNKTKTNESIVCKDFEFNVNNNDLNFAKNESTNGCEDNDKNLVNSSAKEDNNRFEKKKSTFDGKDLIKLYPKNEFSKTDVFERRKQKFGQTVGESVDDFSCDSVEIETNSNKSKTSIKSRLTNDSNKERRNRKNCRHNQNNGKDVESSQRHHSNARHMNPNDDIDGCDNHSSKKRLRSLVVMK